MIELVKNPNRYLKGSEIIVLPHHFEDERGSYRELYNKKGYNSLNIEFVQDDISISKRNVLRGIHGDAGTWKLVSCLKGSFELVIVNCDKEDIGFGKWELFYLEEGKNIQILIPPKFGNGHLVTSDEAIFHYKQSTYYGDYKQFTVKWNAETLGIPWSTKEPILSERDQLGPFSFFL
jgi:dTDP-4-dehydrorhamnose 3,5-epimerase